MKIVSSWHLFSRPFQPFKYSVIEKSWWSQQVTYFKMAEERHRAFMHKVSIEACLYGLGANMTRGDPIKADGDCPFSATLSQVRDRI